MLVWRDKGIKQENTTSYAKYDASPSRGSRLSALRTKSLNLSIFLTVVHKKNCVSAKRRIVLFFLQAI